jgi:hypothetical protein
MNKVDRFDDIAHKPLQAYNRAVMFYNTYEDQGPAAAQEYADQFSMEDRTNMARIVSLVKRKGVKYVRDAVTKGVDFPFYRASEDVVT